MLGNTFEILQTFGKIYILLKAMFKWVNVFPMPDFIHLGLVKVKLHWTKKTLFKTIAIGENEINSPGRKGGMFYKH